MEKTVKKFGRPNLIIALVVIIAIVIGGGLEYNHNHNKNSSSNAGAAVKWDTYKDTTDKFQFTYPDPWGKPHVQVISYSPGKEYSITFAAPAPDKSNESLDMESTDVAKRVCITSGNCQTVPTLTGDSIKQQLSKATYKFVAKDADSFATLSNSVGFNNLSIYRIVNLPDLNISAASGFYAKKASSTKCSLTSFGADAMGCISQTVYTQLNTTLGSIKSL